MTPSIRPALSNWLDLVRAKARVSDPVINRFQQPVPKVQRRPSQFADGFEGSQARQSARSATPMPKPGANNATHFHRDGFEVAAKKPVELAWKPSPAARARVNVMRF